MQVKKIELLLNQLTAERSDDETDFKRDLDDYVKAEMQVWRVFLGIERDSFQQTSEARIRERIEKLSKVATNPAHAFANDLPRVDHWHQQKRLDLSLATEPVISEARKREVSNTARSLFSKKVKGGPRRHSSSNLSSAAAAINSINALALDPGRIGSGAQTATASLSKSGLGADSSASEIPDLTSDEGSGNINLNVSTESPSRNRVFFWFIQMGVFKGNFSFFEN